VDELAESAEDLYDNAPCGYLSTTPDGTIVRVNATFLRWTGYRREELVGARRLSDLLTAGGRIYHETHYAPLLRMQGSVREIALDLVCAGGDRLPVLLNSQLKLDAGGAPQLVRTTVFEARDRKRYEEELLAARNRERVARERVEWLQRITSAIAVAADAHTMAAAIVGEIVGRVGARGAGIAVYDSASRAWQLLGAQGDLPAGELGPSGPDAGFDEGAPGRDAAAALRFAGGQGTRGRLCLAFDGARAFDEAERAFLRACADQTALGLERVQLYELQRDVSHQLQQSMVGVTLPSDPRYDVATAYHPAFEHLEVGGDWYDAFTLPGDRLAIVVGDVAGRGIVAASAMAQLRSAVRALAGAGFGPAAVLEHMDAFVEQTEAGRYATLAFAAVDLATGAVCCAAAGHLPPLVLQPGAAPEYFLGGRSTPLGVRLGGEERAEATFRLAPGGSFLLYTDGLVERRGESIDVGLERLVAAVAARDEQVPAALVDALLEHDAPHDDVCLLSFHLAQRFRPPD